MKVTVKSTGSATAPAHAGGIGEYYIMRTGSGADAYALLPGYKSDPGVLAPTAVHFGWALVKDEVPVYADLTMGTEPTNSRVTRWLVLEFPANSAAFFTIEVEALARRGMAFTTLS